MMRHVLERQSLWLGWAAFAAIGIVLVGSVAFLAWWCVDLAGRWIAGTATPLHGLYALALICLALGFFRLIPIVRPAIRNFLKYGGDTIWLQDGALHVRPIDPIALSEITRVDSILLKRRSILRVTLRSGETLDVFPMSTPDATLSSIRARLASGPWTA